MTQSDPSNFPDHTKLLEELSKGREEVLLLRQIFEQMLILNARIEQIVLSAK